MSKLSPIPIYISQPFDKYEDSFNSTEFTIEIKGKICGKDALHIARMLEQTDADIPFFRLIDIKALEETGQSNPLELDSIIDCVNEDHLQRIKDGANR